MDEIRRARRERKEAEARRMNNTDRKKMRSGGVSKWNNFGRQARWLKRGWYLVRVKKLPHVVLIVNRMYSVYSSMYTKVDQ